MFFLTHDERSGKPRVALDVLGVGLAAAALTELALTGAVYIEPESGQVTRYATDMPADAACQYILEQIYKLEPQTYTATDWIMVLRDDLYLGVAKSLQGDGFVKAVRAPIGRSMRYQPTPQSLGEQPLAWVFGVLRSRYPRDFEVFKLVLTCLCVAMGAATAVCAISPEDVDRAYPVILQSCDDQTVAVAKAAGQVKRKLSMTVRR